MIHISMMQSMKDLSNFQSSFAMNSNFAFYFENFLDVNTANIASWLLVYHMLCKDKFIANNITEWLKVLYLICGILVDLRSTNI